MLFRIDPASGVAIFDQLAASVRGELARGGLRASDRLPAAREVAAALDINIHTVLKAYQELRDEGLVDLRRGRGAVVTARGVRAAGALAALTAYIEQARKAGFSVDEATRLVREGMTS